MLEIFELCYLRAMSSKYFKQKIDLLVWNGTDFLVLNSMEKRSKNSPSFRKLITTHEVHLRSTKDVQNQSFIGVRKFQILLQ